MWIAEENMWIAEVCGSLSGKSVDRSENVWIAVVPLFGTTFVPLRRPYY